VWRWVVAVDQQPHTDENNKLKLDIVVTCSAPINMAVVKYWGKDNEDLIIPCNNSISATLDWKRMHSKTTIMASKKFTEDKFWLNNK